MCWYYAGPASQMVAQHSFSTQFIIFASSTYLAIIPANTKHLYSICTMLGQRRRRLADVVRTRIAYVTSRNNIIITLCSVNAWPKYSRHFYFRPTERSIYCDGRTIYKLGHNYSAQNNSPFYFKLGVAPNLVVYPRPIGDWFSLAHDEIRQSPPSLYCYLNQGTCRIPDLGRFNSDSAS